MIEVKTLKELVKLMTANDLTELELQDAQGERVSLKRGSVGAPAGQQPVVQYVPAPAAASPVAAGSPAAASGVPAGEEGWVPIKSPMVGTFYASPSPDAKAFVAVGSDVNPESVVCIIEAMKVFNEIKAETTGVITKILVNNGQAVEFGQPIYMVKPA